MDYKKKARKKNLKIFKSAQFKLLLFLAKKMKLHHPLKSLLLSKEWKQIKEIF